MYIGIDELRAGMILDESLFDDNDKLLVPSNTELTDLLITKIKNHNLRNKNIKISKYSLSGKDIITLNRIKYWDNNFIPQVLDDNLYNEVYTSLKNTDFIHGDSIDEITTATNNLVNEIFYRKISNNEKVYIDPVEYLYNDSVAHAIRVATLSIIIGAEFNKTNHEDISLYELAQAALLYNYGERLFKTTNSKLKNMEINSYLSDTYNIDNSIFEDGYNSRNLSIYSYTTVPVSNKVGSIILYSGEDDKGNGPLKINVNEVVKSESILYASKIVRLCSVYDNLVKSLIGKDNAIYFRNTNGNIENGVGEENNYINLKYINVFMDYCKKEHLLDSELVDILLHSVPLFPAGTRVQLSNGEYARIMENKNNILSCVAISTTNRLYEINTNSDIKIKSVIDENMKLSNMMQINYNYSSR